MTATDVVWVGIDAGKTSHHAVAVDAGGKKLWSAKVANGQQPVKELIARAAKSAGDGEVRWAVDLVSPAAALLLAILLSSGQKAVYVPGRVVHGMSGVFRGEGKTDAKDARVIAGTARMRGDLAGLTVTDELVVELARLTSYRADVTADWVLRQVFYMTALSSIRPEGPSKAFYQRQRGENKHHTQALLALARRLADVLWALLRDNRTWSPVPPPQIIATAA